MPQHRRSLIACVVLLVALVGSACDSSGEAPDATTIPGSTTTETDATTTTPAPVTSIPADSIPGENSASIPDAVAASMRAQIGVIILDVEESRALPFLEVPTVTILDQEEFTARVNSQLEEDLDDEELAAQDAMLTLLGMLDEDVDLRDLLVDLYTEQVAGFYDPEAREMVVPVSVDGITPLQEIVIAHELVHALTDQHFEFNGEYERRIEQGTGDDASGLLALVEGDATYQQFLYLESFDPAKAARAALEAFSIDTSVLDAAPAWIQKDLAFPYEHGLVFTGYLISQGGLEAIDRAYQAPPISSEQILDPNKYLRNEQPSEIDPLTVQLEGWDLVEEASLGEWGVRLLLTDTLRPGELAQAASGWGNDTYRFFTRDGDAAFVWSYVAESVADAEDLTNALITHARDAMGATGAVESAGGLLFEGASPFVFIDRIDDGIFFIAATDSAAVTDARSQLGI
ncbi:MAG: hypothetical protein R6W79_05920 [Acidimicrobiia bacterium]